MDESVPQISFLQSLRPIGSLYVIFTDSNEMHIPDRLEAFACASAAILSRRHFPNHCTICPSQCHRLPLPFGKRVYDG
jgi:hypothetical protein